MMEFLKKQKASFYLSVVAGIITIAGLIVFAIGNAVESYGMIGAPGVIVGLVVAILLIGVGSYGMGKFGEKPWVSACLFVALVLICLGMAFSLANRVSLAATLFTYDWSNTSGWAAFTTGMASMVIFLVAAIALTVGAFFKFGTKEN